MGINFVSDAYTRITQAIVTVPVKDKPDLHEPQPRGTWLTVIPTRVRIALTQEEGRSGGDRAYALVFVYGPRRLKSGAVGKEITTTGWEASRIEGKNCFIDRPDWLTKVIAENLPRGWDPALVGLTVSAQ